MALLTSAAIPTAEIAPEVLEILGHSTLRLYCLLGSLGGSVLALGLTPTSTLREMAWKWTVGVISGLMFTPTIVKMCGLPPTIDYLVCISGAVSLLAWGVLHKLTPLLERVIIARARKLAGDKSDPSTTTPPAR